ncbi:MAG: hypothetical protein LBI33_12840 [Propionibacteriaceae bacterium]|jgi:hypothetical protein|nr:hypothetical protein [Propionibacteriaceae bacterium]
MSQIFTATTDTARNIFIDTMILGYHDHERVDLYQQLRLLLALPVGSYRVEIYGDAVIAVYNTTGERVFTHPDPRQAAKISDSPSDISDPGYQYDLGSGFGCRVVYQA